jgi:predicted transcriptional regulator
VHSSPDYGRRQRRYSVHCQARLDAETHTKLEKLASTCHRKRSAILRFVMQWGLRHSGGWTIDRSTVVAVPPVPVLLEPELLQQVQDAAAAHGVSVTAWVRHAMRQVTIEDFPQSWRAGESSLRSHDSRYYGQRFMLRLDDTTTRKLQRLVEQVAKSRAEIIRQLVAQAKPEDFPETWQLEAEESRTRRAAGRSGRRSTPTVPRRQRTWRKTDA